METGSEDEGYRIETEEYDYSYLCAKLKNKKLIPMIGIVKGKKDISPEMLTSHQGEEFTYVLEGEMEIHSEYYAPVRVKAGEYVYLDSSMPHFFVSVSDKPAKVICICSSPTDEMSENGMK